MLFTILAGLACIISIFCTKKVFLMILGVAIGLDLISHYLGFFTLKFFMVILAAGIIRLGFSYYRPNYDKNYNNYIVSSFIVIIVFIAYYIISYFFAINQGNHLVKMVQYFILFLTMFIVVFYSHNSLNFFNKAIIGLKLATIINATYGLFQIIFYFLDFNDKAFFLANFSYNKVMIHQITQWTVQVGNNTIPRATGFFNDPSLLGGLLLCGLPFFLIRTTPSGKRNSNNMFISIIILTILFTWSRSVWFAFCVQFLFILFLNSINWLQIKKLYLWGFILTITFVSVITNLGEIFFQRFLQTFDSFNYSTAGHLLFAEEGLNMFCLNPIFGVGLGNFSEFLGYHAMSHSFPITVLSEQGLLGFMFMTLFLILILVIIFRIHNKQLKAVFFLSLVGLLAGNIGYDYHNQAYIWFFLGIVLTSTSKNFNLLIKGKENFISKESKIKGANREYNN